LTSGKCEITVRKATHDDLDAIKCLADKHRVELGFVLRPALAKSIERGEVFVAENSEGIVGFVEYRHRQDEQTTLYHIAVQHDHRQISIGRQLVQALFSEAGQREKRHVQLKCPIDLEANEFYERLGFSQLGIQHGRKRDLVVWQIPISPAISS
jgi:ribosomal protein S18 acetylase RimI-like enzyme